MARRLYSEACIRDLAAGGELVLARGELITPAALDLAFARGIRVRWSDEAPASSTASGKAPASPSPLWSTLLAADGNYLVEVKNGRARVFRLAAGGPTLVGEGV